MIHRSKSELKFEDLLNRIYGEKYKLPYYLMNFGGIMAGIRFQITDELEKKFREAAMKRFGYGKGALSLAAEEALSRWLSYVSWEEIGFDGDPVEALDGLLVGIDLDSVELQHLAKKMWMGEAPGDVSHRH
ncbi:MAG: hypothetical protein ACE5GD_00545 [Candidatus Geothermarchaeales archaeon]